MKERTEGGDILRHGSHCSSSSSSSCCCCCLFRCDDASGEKSNHLNNCCRQGETGNNQFCPFNCADLCPFEGITNDDETFESEGGDKPSCDSLQNWLIEMEMEREEEEEEEEEVKEGADVPLMHELVELV